LAEAALVIGEDLKVPGREKLEDGRGATQVAARAADAEQARAGTPEFII
jgi:hypothetical protein